MVLVLVQAPRVPIKEPLQNPYSNPHSNPYSIPFKEPPKTLYSGFSIRAGRF